MCCISSAFSFLLFVHYDLFVSLFSKEEIEGVKLVGWGGGGPGRSWERGTIIRIHFMKKLFLINRKSCATMSGLYEE